MGVRSSEKELYYRLSWFNELSLLRFGLVGVSFTRTFYFNSWQRSCRIPYVELLSKSRECYWIWKEEAGYKYKKGVRYSKHKSAVNRRDQYT